MFVTLPILMALSWVPSPATTTNASPTNPSPTPANAPQQAVKAAPAQAAETVTCPLTGEEIPSCCCPVKK